MVLKDTDIGRLILEHTSSHEKTAESKSKTSIEDAKKISEGLVKVAGFPYKEEIYKSVQEMMKIASQCISDLTKSLESVETRNSEFEKAAEVRSLIDEMINNGMVDDFNAEEKVAELMSKDNHQLDVIKQAMKMIKDGKEGNVFFEVDKTASISDYKKGMFDGVID